MTSSQPAFNLRTLRGKSICIIHWTQCKSDAMSVYDFLQPFAKHVNVLAVTSNQQLRENVFNELSHYNTVIMLGFDESTKKCMAIHMRGKEQSYLVELSKLVPVLQ